MRRTGRGAADGLPPLRPHRVLHDGSWFHPLAKLWLFLPSGVIVFALWVTGIYLFLLPIRSRRAKARGESLKASPPRLRVRAGRLRGGEPACLAVRRR